MKKENIIERVRELMGLGVLNEAVPGSLVLRAEKIAKFLITNFGPKNKLSKLGRQIDDLIRTNRTSRNVQNLDQKLTYLLSKINYKSLGKQLFKTLQSEDEKINKFIERTDDIAKKLKTYDEVINDIKNSDFVRTVYNRAVGNNTSEPLPNELVQVAEKYNELLLKEFKDFYSKYNYSGLKKWLSLNETTSMKALRQIFTKYWWKNQESLARELQLVTNAIEIRLNNNQVIHDQVKKLFNVVVAHKKSLSDDISGIMKKYVSENPLIPKEIKDQMMNEKYIKTVVENLYEDPSKVLPRIIREKLSAYGKSLKLWTKEGWKRAFNTIAIKNPQFLDEILAQTIRNGKAATIGEKIAGYLIIHNGLIPALIGGAETLFQNLPQRSKMKELEEIKKLCDEKLIPLESCPTEEDIKSLTAMTEKEFFDNMKKNMPLYKLVYGSDGGRKFDDWLFFSWLDEITRAAWNTYRMFTFTLDEQVTFFEKQLSEIKEKVNKHLMENGINPNDKDWEVKLRALMKQKAEDTKKEIEKKIQTIPTDSIKQKIQQINPLDTPKQNIRQVSPLDTQRKKPSVFGN
jgi:hypothetical protein